jgi:hypothetical protein
MTNFSIPAACLEALGGLAETDAPVLLHKGKPMHPLGNCPGINDGYLVGIDRLILPQSAPALLQVLTRHVGLDPSHGVMWTRDRRVRCGHPGGMWPGGSPPMDMIERRFQAHTSDGERRLQKRRGMERLWVIIPTLTPSMSRMRVIAEVVVWLARVERVQNDAPLTPHGMDLLECALKLPAWKVES